MARTTTQEAKERALGSQTDWNPQAGGTSDRVPRQACSSCCRRQVVAPRLNRSPCRPVPRRSPPAEPAAAAGPAPPCRCRRPWQLQAWRAGAAASPAGGALWLRGGRPGRRGAPAPHAAAAPRSPCRGDRRGRGAVGSLRQTTWTALLPRRVWGGLQQTKRSKAGGRTPLLTNAARPKSYQPFRRFTLLAGRHLPRAPHPAPPPPASRDRLPRLEALHAAAAPFAGALLRALGCCGARGVLRGCPQRPRECVQRRQPPALAPLLL